MKHIRYFMRFIVVTAIFLVPISINAATLVGTLGTVTLNCTNFVQAGFTNPTWRTDRQNTGSFEVEEFNLTIRDGSGNVLLSLTFNGSPFGAGVSLNNGTWNYVSLPLSNPLSFRFVSVAGNGLPEQVLFSASGNCATLPSPADEPPPDCPVFYDGRINNCDTGNWIVIYGHTYESGRGLLIMDTSGENLLQVSPEQIAAVPECPDVNTLIASAGNVAFYRLAGSCLYQVNGSAADGKTYVVIFDELYANAGYNSHEE